MKTRADQAHVAICGGLAVGKTTLARSLSARMSAQLVEENPSECRFIREFYADQKRWSFHSRMGMLALFLNNYHRTETNRGLVILDRCIHELIVFARLQRKLDNLTSEEYSLYSDLHRAVVRFLKPIDVFVYLHCPPPVSLDRMAARGRPFERKVSEGYVRAVAQEYESWLQDLEHVCPVLRLNTSLPIDMDSLVAALPGVKDAAERE